jgi:2-hydroxy-6-oxonona-2,4-dienedioate hydrolase
MWTLLPEIGTAIAALAGAAAVAWRIAAVAAGRRNALRRGEIRELGHLWTTARGCRIFARTSHAPADPDRIPVVLVHGLGVSSSYLVPTAERLATEFAVYAPDLPGHGRSETPRDPMDVPRLADALVAWMDAMALGRVCLVANSMGCQVVVQVALHHPERVDRLVLTGPTLDPSARRTFALIGRLVLCVPFERPSLIALVLKDYARMGPRIFAEFRAMQRDRMEDRLPRVAVPTMWVRGEHDFIAPRRWVDEATCRAGAGRFVEIPWWGHAVNFSAARPLADAIAPFLRAAHRSQAHGGRGTAFECTGSPRD